MTKVSSPAEKLKSLDVLRIILVTTAGTAVVFAGMIFMNRAAHEPEAIDIGPVVSFAVPQQTERPKPKEEEPQRRPRQSTNEPALAPLPDLGSALSGIAVALPEFQAEGVTDVSDSLLGDLDNVALTEDAVDNPPSPRTRVVPVYPERAKQRDIEGSVLVSVLVGTDGRIQSIKVLESVPPGVFDATVETAIRQWTFEPATYRGRPVETWVNIPFPFRLN